jgi:HSP20 family protein
MANTNSLEKVEKKEATPLAVAESLRNGVHYTPRVDVLETADELTFFCDMPGVKLDDLNLRYENGELTIYGKVEPRHQPAGYFVNEYGVGDFYRSFNVDAEVDAEKISAEYKLGVLTVHLPKAEAVKPKRIPIKG